MPNLFDLSSTVLDLATTEFTISGEASPDRLGFSAGSAGDVNGDGSQDIFVSAAYEQNNGRGAAYLIYGGKGVGNVDLSSTVLNSATTGFKIAGNADGDQFGNSAKEAEDVKGDGCDDIVIGVYSKNRNQGAAYLIYSSNKIFRMFLNNMHEAVWKWRVDNVKKEFFVSLVRKGLA